MSVLDLFKLEDKVAVVTGAGKGIGRGTVSYTHLRAHET